MESKTSASLNQPFHFERFFTYDGKSPFEFDIYGNPINWVSEEVKVTDDQGRVIFVQPNVRRPEFWSPLAIKVVASKYFWGDQAKNQRENSAEQLVGRVARFIGRQALLQKYFDAETSKKLQDEVAAICLNQLAVFNSPVWFNAGINEYDSQAGGVGAWKWDAATDTIIHAHKGEDRPQCSACFIQGITDNIDSIMEVQVAEVNLFKAGSGTGTNRSPLRSSREKLTGGGRPSGPLSFMKGYDAYAAIIKSGGKTRRAAKMEILNVEHPDIIDFIESKQKEEKKAWALIEQGYAGGMNGDAYNSISFQNCNMSVRAPDEFMQAVKRDGEWQTKFVTKPGVCETLKAKEILRKIAEGTWICGDPGMQFDTIINAWHTSKNTGRINASNPCSEYMFLDDSACNLASINLMKFRTDDGRFDVEKFKRVVKTFSISMDLIVDGASYPTQKICRNSRDYRPLGVGYANLGALLMSLGLSYDSDEGRAVAAAITSIMGGESYRTSAELARSVGPFPGFAKNREPMLEVMRMHRDAVKKIEVNKMPAELRYLVNEAWDCWDEAVKLGEQFGFRNSQMTVLAPTGTIAFMMDCDTTGIEPDIALVKYKVLAGGGMLKIVNRSVPLALRTLGYTEAQIEPIIDFIDKNDTIEGAPGLKEEHLDVFDCAFKAAKGKRYIHHRGHIKMMGVCQPFISGAISKTVNMPEHSTVDDIADSYLFAWEQGLKAVAIYRENSKRSQPLNTQKTDGEMVKKEGAKDKSVITERTKLPQTRKSMTHKFDIAGHEGYITVGLYDNGKPGEIFVTMHKQGSTIRGLMDSWATSVSLNLQYGIPVDVLFNKFRHSKFEPAGFVKNQQGGELDGKMPKIRMSSSIVDYVSQFMLNNFGESSGPMEFEVATVTDTINVKEEQKTIKDFGNEGLVCPLCGGPAKRIGNCAITCTSCNNTSRSGCGE
jgi:ribonucleoside-diphosphate reductase alpha chain